MSYALQPGDSVSLEESGARDDQVIVDKVQGHACPVPQRPHAKERTLCADLLFTPGLGPAGKREVFAVVTRNGMPITRVLIATFHVAASPLPSKPGHLQLIRQGSNVVVDWSRVAHESDFDLTGFPAIRGWLKRVAGDPGHVPMDWHPAAAAIVE